MKACSGFPDEHHAIPMASSWLGPALAFNLPYDLWEPSVEHNMLVDTAVHHRYVCITLYLRYSGRIKDCGSMFDST